MNRILIFAAVVLPIALTLGLAQWFDWLHVGTAVLGVTGALWFISRAISGKVTRSAKASGHSRRRALGYQPVLYGLLSGVAVAGLVAALHVVLLAVPTARMLYTDRDLSALERRLDQLEAEEKWQHAAAVIEQRITTAPLSSDWRTALLKRQFYDFVQAATIAPKRADQDQLVSRAETVAREHQLAAALPAALRERANLREELSAATATELQQERSLKQLHEQLSDLAAQRQQLVRARIADLLKMGSDLTDFDARTSAYDAAERLAIEQGLPTDGISPGRAQLAQEIAASQPSNLPAGSSAALVRVGSHASPPIVVMEVSVRGPSGEPLAGLRAKDFQVSSGAYPLPIVGLAETISEPPALQLTLLLDASSSTQGNANEQMRRGATQLLYQLPATARVYGFGSSVNRLTSWTSEKDELAQAVAGIRPLGQTAMLQALDQATADLALRRGTRAAVLFTDGRDTVGRPPLAPILARCAEQQIAVHVVALQTAELDERLLRQIAQQTGGFYLTAEQAESLPQRFEQLRLNLCQPVYRLAVETSSRSVGPVSLRIGLANAVEIVSPPGDTRVAN